MTDSSKFHRFNRKITFFPDVQLIMELRAFERFFIQQNNMVALTFIQQNNMIALTFIQKNSMVALTFIQQNNTVHTEKCLVVFTIRWLIQLHDLVSYKAATFLVVVTISDSCNDLGHTTI